MKEREGDRWTKSMEHPWRARTGHDPAARSLRIVPSLPNRGPSSDRSGIGAIESLSPPPLLGFEASVITGPADLSPLPSCFCLRLPPPARSCYTSRRTRKIPSRPMSASGKVIYSGGNQSIHFSFVSTVCAPGDLRRSRISAGIDIPSSRSVFFFFFAEARGWIRFSFLSLFLSFVGSIEKGIGKSEKSCEENPL